MDEFWEVCEDFPDFAVSDLGRVMNATNQKLVPTRMNKQNLLMVTIKDPMGYQFTRLVSLLVAKAFIEVPNPWFTSVIHLNGDRSDCRAMNIMWRSRPFAQEYHKMFNQTPLRVSVIIKETGEYFYSLRELCTKYGLIEHMVYNQIDKNETCFPYNWRIERTNV